MAVDASDQLAWEKRAGRLAAGAAALAAICFVAGGLYLQLAVERRPTGSNELVTSIARESSDYIVAGIISALGSLLLGVVLAYLYRVIRARREKLPRAALALTVFGALGSAAVAIARPVDLGIVAGQIPAGSLRTNEATDAFLRDRTSLQIIGGFGLAANLALAFSMIIISINAMRTGILSRFVAVLGIVIGALLPLVGAMPILLFFWLVALAALFLDRWPGGRGPAWASGEAIPWPNLAARNAEIDRRRVAAEAGEEDDGEAGPRSGPAPVEGAGDGDEVPAGAQPNGGPPPGSSRAKRKHGRRR